MKYLFVILLLVGCGRPQCDQAPTGGETPYNQLACTPAGSIVNGVNAAVFYTLRGNSEAGSQTQKDAIQAAYLTVYSPSERVAFLQSVLPKADKTPSAYYGGKSAYQLIEDELAVAAYRF